MVEEEDDEDDENGIAIAILVDENRRRGSGKAHNNTHSLRSNTQQTTASGGARKERIGRREQPIPISCMSAISQDAPASKMHKAPPAILLDISVNHLLDTHPASRMFGQVVVVDWQSDFMSLFRPLVAMRNRQTYK